MEAIWPLIKAQDPVTKRENCRTRLMGRHAQMTKLRSIAIACEKPLELVHTCLVSNIGIIALCRTDPIEPWGHFCVVTGMDYKGVYLNDPWMDERKGHNRILRIGDFIPALRPTGEVATKNTLAQQDCNYRKRFCRAVFSCLTLACSI